MAVTTTTRLGMVKPTPGTNELVDVETQLNENWDRIDAAIGALVCTSGTRPATPYDGQIIRESDTRQIRVWNATQGVWEYLFGPNAFTPWFLQLSPPSGGATAGVRVYSTGPAALNRALAFRGSGDTVDHYFVDYDGTMQWGTGAAGADVNLYRDSAGVLKTDGNFHAAGTASSIGVEAPIPLTLQNGWVNYGGVYQTAVYWKDPFGMVHITGLITSGTTTTGTQVALLPVGYRPAASQIFSTPSADSGHAHMARVDVSSTGSITTNVGWHANYTSLAGISFRAA
jgi:hypothetical protein